MLVVTTDWRYALLSQSCDAELISLSVCIYVTIEITLIAFSYFILSVDTL